MICEPKQLFLASSSARFFTHYLSMLLYNLSPSYVIFIQFDDACFDWLVFLPDSSLKGIE